MDFESIADTIEDDAKEYEELAQAVSWFLIEESEDVDGVVSQKNMEKVYTGRMAAKGGPGRTIYENLKASSPHDLCPLCGHRTVEQLDHYLPKAKFPSLVVLPINLVPSCEKCNKVKLVDVPDSVANQTLHPYYDDVTQYQWLFAEVIDTSPVAFRFFVNSVEQYSPVLNARIKYHFKSLDLNTLYTSQAGAILGDIYYRLNILYELGGDLSVRKYLHEEESSRRSNNVNSWQTAMYQAMRESDWFCDGGFIAP